MTLTDRIVSEPNEVRGLHVVQFSSKEAW